MIVEGFAAKIVSDLFLLLDFQPHRLKSNHQSVLVHFLQKPIT